MGSNVGLDLFLECFRKSKPSAEFNRSVRLIPRESRPSVIMKSKTASPGTSVAEKLRHLLTPKPVDDDETLNLHLPFKPRHLQELHETLTKQVQECKEIVEMIYGYPDYNQDLAYPLPSTEEEFDREMTFWLSCDINKLRTCFDRSPLGPRQRAFENGVTEDNKDIFNGYVAFKYNELMEHGNGSSIPHDTTDTENIFTQRQMCLIDMVEPRLYEKVIIAWNRFIEACHSNTNDNSCDNKPQYEWAIVFFEYYKEFIAFSEFKGKFESLTKKEQT